MGKRALITGIAGQDGSYLTDLLLEKGYEVFGVVGPNAHCDAADRRSGVEYVHADVTDMDSLLRVMETARPDEVYNLASLSSVGDSWSAAVATAEINAVGVLRVLEAVRSVVPEARVFQASSAEIFGSSGAPGLQDESTPLDPRSPYAIAKAYGYHIVRSYRDAHGMHASNGILYNHESPLRGPQFVTRRITEAAARIKLGLQQELELGNLDARRDWGFAGDYVVAMWLMLQHPAPDDYVLATGEARSVRELCETAFSHLGMDYQQYVKVDPARLRPVDVPVLRGDASKARAVLGWEPKVGFRELIHMMVDADMGRLSAGL